MLNPPNLKVLIVFMTSTMAACIKCPTEAKRLAVCKLIEIWMPPAAFSSNICPKIQTRNQKTTSRPSKIDDQEADDLWSSICAEAISNIKQDPSLAQYFQSSILLHSSLEASVACQLAIKLGNRNLSTHSLAELFISILTKSDGTDDQVAIRKAIREDLKAIKERDPACISYVHCLLNYKGFLACQGYRIAHKLWKQGRTALALFIQSRVSEVFGVDIHPRAKIGIGIMFDHATGIVIGETAVIGNNVTILHNVTLGGTGKVDGDRHPKIEDEVFIGAGASVLGNIRIGHGVKIGAGAMVLKGVPAEATIVGNPSRLLPRREEAKIL